MSQALVMPCKAPNARLYSGRLVHPGTPQARAATGAPTNEATTTAAKPFLNDKARPPAVEARHPATPRVNTRQPPKGARRAQAPPHMCCESGNVQESRVRRFVVVYIFPRSSPFGQPVGRATRQVIARSPTRDRATASTYA